MIRCQQIQYGKLLIIRLTQIFPPGFEDPLMLIILKKARVCHPFGHIFWRAAFKTEYVSPRQIWIEWPRGTKPHHKKDVCPAPGIHLSYSRLCCVRGKICSRSFLFYLCRVRFMPPPRRLTPGGCFMIASMELRDGNSVKYILIAPFTVHSDGKDVQMVSLSFNPFVT